MEINYLNQVLSQRRVWLQVEDIWSFDRNLGELSPHDSVNKWLKETCKLLIGHGFCL